MKTPLDTILRTGSAAKMDNVAFLVVASTMQGRRQVSARAVLVMGINALLETSAFLLAASMMQGGRQVSARTFLVMGINALLEASASLIVASTILQRRRVSARGYLQMGRDARETTSAPLVNAKGRGGGEGFASSNLLVEQVLRIRPLQQVEWWHKEVLRQTRKLYVG